MVFTIIPKQFQAAFIKGLEFDINTSDLINPCKNIKTAQNWERYFLRGRRYARAVAFGLKTENEIIM